MAESMERQSFGYNVSLQAAEEETGGEEEDGDGGVRVLRTLLK